MKNRQVIKVGDVVITKKLYPDVWIGVEREKILVVLGITEESKSTGRIFTCLDGHKKTDPIHEDWLEKV